MAHDTATDKWTDITLLPEWEEEFYHVYTARKHGKWVMLKTLKPQFKYVDEYRDMLDKEFEVRYNLAHPHIVMINDLEDIPGLGRCIITDDVYGDSLRKLIDQGRVTPAIIDRIRQHLLEAIEYIQTNHIVHHPIRPETIIFTENIGNLKLIDVGFDRKNHLDKCEADDDIFSFGRVLDEALKACPVQYPQLNAVAERCMNDNPRQRYRDIQELRMALAQRSSSRLYIIIITFLSLMVLLLAWLLSPYSPSRPEPETAATETAAGHHNTNSPQCL